jgi:hypothetical protein
MLLTKEEDNEERERSYRRETETPHGTLPIDQ